MEDFPSKVEVEQSRQSRAREIKLILLELGGFLKEIRVGEVRAPISLQDSHICAAKITKMALTEERCVSYLKHLCAHGATQMKMQHYKLNLRGNQKKKHCLQLHASRGTV